VRQVLMAQKRGPADPMAEGRTIGRVQTRKELMQAGAEAKGGAQGAWALNHRVHEAGPARTTPGSCHLV